MAVSQMRQFAILDPTILYPISWSDKIMEDEIFRAAAAQFLRIPILGALNRKDQVDAGSRLPAMCSSRDQKAIRPGAAVCLLRRGAQ